jgi:flavin reductase (DIM6/NTAB) family NADH-FMN oxidoreductase RutF
VIGKDPGSLKEREVYKLLTGTIVPRPIAFVTSLSEDGVLNGAPFSYFNIVSTDPPIVSLAIQRKNGVMKDTARNILEKKEFVIHAVDQNNLEKINETSASLPPEESEIELAKLSTLPSTNINVPGIEESKVRLEAVLYKHIEIKNEEMVTSDLLLGQVVFAHISEEIHEDGRIHMKAYDPVARLAGPNYSTLGEIIHLKRPE